MYADFSTVRIHINENELDTLMNARNLLNKIADYLDEENKIDITVDIGEDSEAHLSNFMEKILYDAIEALDKIIDD